MKYIHTGKDYSSAGDYLTRENSPADYLLKLTMDALVENQRRVSREQTKEIVDRLTVRAKEIARVKGTEIGEIKRLWKD